MNYSTLLGGLLLALCPSILRAQPTTAFRPGYVISLSGDTLRGYLVPPVTRTMAQAIVFRQQLTDDDTRIVYPLKLIRGAGLAEGKQYVVRKMQPILGRDTLRLLFQPLVRGPVTLYRLDYDVRASSGMAINDTSYENTFYYLGQGTSALVELRQTSFRAIFNNLLAGCGSPPTTGRFDEANLVRLITSYYTCTGTKR